MRENKVLTFFHHLPNSLMLYIHITFFITSAYLYVNTKLSLYDDKYEHLQLFSESDSVRWWAIADFSVSCNHIGSKFQKCPLLCWFDKCLAVRYWIKYFKRRRRTLHIFFVCLFSDKVNSLANDSLNKISSSCLSYQCLKELDGFNRAKRHLQLDRVSERKQTSEPHIKVK